MAYDSRLVVYTGVPLSYISVTPGMNLQTILQNINNAVNSLNPVPDYSSFTYGPYHGYTLRTPSNAAITTITGFVEGTANAIGKVSSDLSTFISSTYASGQTTLTNAVAAVATPGLTYSHSAGGVTISIANTDTQLQVLTKLANGIGDISDKLGAPGNTWSTLSLSTPTNLSQAFNSLISYCSGLNTAIAGKQAAIGTFDNSSNCLSGTSTDSIRQTISLLTTYVCSTTPLFDASSITTSCLSTQSSLQDWVQGIVNSLDSLINSTVIGATDSSLSVSSTSCGGKTLTVNASSPKVTKVLNTSSDTTPGYLSSKIAAGSNISISTLNSGGNEQLQITATYPSDSHKILINAADTDPGYLAAKLLTGQGDWGISLVLQPNTDNSKLTLLPKVTDPYLLVENTLNYISNNPALLGLFCSVIGQCATNSCNPPTSFSVVASHDDLSFTLTWTYGSAVLSQIVKYRLLGDLIWITSANITPPNPQTSTATTVAVSPGCTNVVIEFQVDSICTSGTNGSAILQGIVYSQQTLSTNVTNAVVSVTQAAMPTVATIEYILYRQSGQSQIPVQTILATGSNPTASFSAVNTSGTYFIKYAYSTLINGTTVSSTDSSQEDAYYESGTFIVSVQ